MIYEWDYAHGNVEVYDGRGHHTGARSFPKGEAIGGPIKSRRIEP